MPPMADWASQVDIASSDNIEINSSGVDASFAGLVLDSTDLTGIGASSLLIGGYRQNSPSGTAVIVTTDNLVVNNPGEVLQAGDVILASNGALTLSTGSTVVSTGSGFRWRCLHRQRRYGRRQRRLEQHGEANTVTLASSTLPSGFGIGSTFLGSTVQSINGATVTLAGVANAAVSNGSRHARDLFRQRRDRCLQHHEQQDRDPGLGLCSGRLRRRIDVAGFDHAKHQRHDRDSGRQRRHGHFSRHERVFLQQRWRPSPRQRRYVRHRSDAAAASILRT